MDALEAIDRRLTNNKFLLETCLNVIGKPVRQHSADEGPTLLQFFKITTALMTTMINKMARMDGSSYELTSTDHDSYIDAIIIAVEIVLRGDADLVKSLIDELLARLLCFRCPIYAGNRFTTSPGDNIAHVILLNLHSDGYIKQSDFKQHHISSFTLARFVYTDLEIFFEEEDHEIFFEEMMDFDNTKSILFWLDQLSPKEQEECTNDLLTTFNKSTKPFPAISAFYNRACDLSFERAYMIFFRNDDGGCLYENCCDRFHASDVNRLITNSVKLQPQEVRLEVAHQLVEVDHRLDPHPYNMTGGLFIHADMDNF